MAERITIAGQEYGPDLTSLNLEKQRLDAWPPKLEHLSKLEELRLGKTGLTALPESIGRLSRLKVLDLRFNHLSRLPDGIGRLVRLRALDLSNNHLETLPKSMSGLTQLETLDLRGNPLPGADLLLPPKIQLFLSKLTWIRFPEDWRDPGACLESQLSPSVLRRLTGLSTQSRRALCRELIRLIANGEIDLEMIGHLDPLSIFKREDEEMDDQDECIICQEGLFRNLNESLIQLDCFCKRLFHAKCLQSVAPKTKGSCPNCQAKVLTFRIGSPRRSRSRN
jgi:Leucine-rich repeat (LRR) protein